MKLFGRSTDVRVNSSDQRHSLECETLKFDLWQNKPFGNYLRDIPMVKNGFDVKYSILQEFIPI